MAVAQPGDYQLRAPEAVGAFQYEGGREFYRHRARYFVTMDLALAAFEAFWWNEVKNGSCRDQLSFDYARWKLDMPIHYLPNHWRDYLMLGKHTR